MSNITHEFRLTFKTANNHSVVLRIPNPDNTVSDEEVRVAMDRIIATQAIEVVEGRPTTRSAASIVTTTRDPFTLSDPIDNDPA